MSLPDRWSGLVGVPARAGPEGGLPPELYQALDEVVIAKVLGLARLSAAADVGRRGFYNLEGLAEEAGRVLQANPILASEIRRVLGTYVGLIECNMLRAVLGA